MSSEYNSELISRLYSAKSMKEEERLLAEMEEINDPVFIHPIFDRWKVHNERQSAISHYFVDSLRIIDSPDALKFAKEIFSTAKILRDTIWSYKIFTKHNYFDEEKLSFAAKLIKNCASDPTKSYLSDYTMEDLIVYIGKAQKSDLIQPSLREIVLNKQSDKELKKVALYHLFRFDPKVEMGWFLDNYKQYQSNELDILLAKELITWTGTLPNNILDFLEINGNSRAKEIIVQFRKEKQKEQAKKEEVQQAKFGNVQLIVEINDIRSQINSKCITSKACGFKLLSESEIMIKQQELVSSKETLIARFIDLRQLFKAVSEKTADGLLSDEAIKKIFPTLPKEEWSKPINRMVIYFRGLGIPLDPDLYGIRRTNRIVNLIVHPENEKDLVQLLKEINLYELYQKQQWALLHQEILLLYKKALNELNKALEKLQ